MSRCDHDWRLDPGVVHFTTPLSRRRVCAKCGDCTGQPQPETPLTLRDIREWPQADPPPRK